MRTVDVILDTLSHFVKGDESPPPGIPVRVESDFETTLLKLCERHSLSPIVFESLQKLALDPGLSEFSLGRLRVLYKTVGVRNKRIIPAVSLLADRLDEEGVSVMFEGDILSAAVLYPSPLLRPIESVEVLVHEADRRKIIDICRDLGFEREVKAPEFHDNDDASFYYQVFAPCTLVNERRIVVDLKFSLLDLGTPRENGMVWQWGRPIDRDEIVGMRISLEDQLLRSCIRLAMSRFGKLLYAVDAGLIVGRHSEELDWSYIEASARDKSFYPAFYFAYERVAECLRLPPLQVELPHPGQVRRKVFDLLWRPGRLGLLPRRRTRLNRFRFYFLESGNWSNKPRVLARLLVPRAEWVSTFFGRPCNPWLRLKFVIFAIRNRLGRPLAHGEDLRYQ